MIKDFLNPIYLISAQVVFYIATVSKYNYVDNYTRVISIVVISYLLLLELAFIIKTIYTGKKQSKKDLIMNKETYLLLNILNIFTIFIIVVTIMKITGEYGGILGFIYNYNFNVIRDIQSSLGDLGSYALILSYINPVVVTIIFEGVDKIKSKILKKLTKILSYVNLIIIFLFSMVIGARIVFIYSIMTLLVVKFKNMKINFKNIKYVIIGIVVLIFFTLYSQNIRNRNMEESQIANISPIEMVSNYYDKSIENSVYVITNQDNKATAEGYWTLKPLFTLPKLYC